MPPRDEEGAVKPLTLRVAIVMFAFLLLSLWWWARMGAAMGADVGAGGHWCVRGAAALGPCPSWPAGRVALWCCALIVVYEREGQVARYGLIHDYN